MKKNAILLTLIFQVFFLAKMFSQTQNNRFLIGWYDYARIETSDNVMAQRFKDMQAYHVNCAIMDTRLTTSTLGGFGLQYFQYASSNPSKAFMDSANKYNLKILLTTPDNSVLILKEQTGWTLLNPYDSIISWQGLEYWGNHPALLGIHIYDEPYSQGPFNYIIPQAKDIRAFNPNLFRFVNFPPRCGDMSFNDYGQFIQDYIDAAQPNILSFDNYPIFNEHIPPKPNWYNDLFYNMDIMSRKSVENEIPFIYVLSSMQYTYLNGSPNPTIKTLSKYAISYFMYAGLCYGAKGLAHWNGNRWLNNIPSQQREFLKNCHKKIMDNEDILLSLRFYSVYHKSTAPTLRYTGLNDSIPPQAKWHNFSSDPLANEIFKANNPLIAGPGSKTDSLAVSFLTDHLGNNYFWVFNKSLTSTERILLNLKTGSGVVDLLNGNSCLLPQNPAIYLEPAEAKLFKFVPNPNTPVINTITENTTWKSRRVVYENIVVAPSMILTIKDTVFFSANASITVSPGGKLIINGGTLTNACEGEMWQGITVLSNPNQLPSTYYQGYVEIKNGGKIENAITGITIKGGAKVKTENAQFINNTIGVKLESLASGQYGATSFFMLTDFILDNGYLGNTAFDAHIKAQSSGEVSVYGCTFSSTVPLNYGSKNNGIWASNTDLTVEEYCHIIPVFAGDTCPENERTISSFSGFENGIYYINSGELPSLKVYYSNFENCYNGIYITGSNYPKLIRNKFYVNNGSGVYIKDLTGYKIEENRFNKFNLSSGWAIGLKIYNTGSAENEIYKNVYTGFDAGQEFAYKNSSQIDITRGGSLPLDPANGKIISNKKIVTGVQTLCNHFTNSQVADIFVHELSSIRQNQGSASSPAGNKFFGTPDFNIANFSQHLVNYYYGSSSNEFPNDAPYKVTKISATQENGCPSKIGEIFICCGGNGQTKGDGEKDLKEYLAQYDKWNVEYEYRLAQLLKFENEQGEKYERALEQVSYFSALKDNYFNSIVGAVMEAESRRQNAASEGVENYELGITNYKTLRFLFNYRGHYTDYLSIVETYLAESNFNESLATVEKIYGQFELTKEQVNELTGLQIYTDWLQQLEKEGNNIYKLSENELEYLVNFVKTNTGRGVVFANNILCELYGICIEDEKIRGLDDKMIINRGLQPTDEKIDKITIVPNPTTGELRIENGELRINDVEIFDIYGRKQQVSNLTSQISNPINIAHLPAGLYFVKINTEAGEVVKKVVKLGAF